MKLPWNKPRSSDPREFWTWFKEFVRTRDISRPDPSVADQITKQIWSVNPQLAWGIAAAANGNPAKFEISAGGIKELIPIVESLVAYAPPIEGWKVVAFRQPSSGFGLDAGGMTITDNDVLWRDAGMKNGLQDLDLYVPVPTGATDDDRIQIGFIVLDHSVGEYAVMTQIGELEFLPVEDAPPGSPAMSSLSGFLGSR